MAEKIEQRSVSVRIDGKEVESSLKNIAKEAANLRTELGAMADANEDYVQKAIRLAQLKEVTDNHRKGVEDIGKAWGKMPIDVKQAVAKTQKELADLEVSIKELKKSEPNSADIKTLEDQAKKLRVGIKTTVDAYMHLGEAAKGSLELIEKEYRDLYAELRKVTIGTQEYQEKAAKLKDLSGQIKQHTEGLNGVEQAWYKNIPAIQGVAAAAIGAFAIDSIMDYGVALVKNATLLDTYSNKTQTVFGEATGSVEQFAATYSTSLGVSSKQTEKLITDIGDLLVPMKFSREEAAKMASEAVRVAGALSEWSGGQYTVADAAKSVQKALTGEMEELERYGVSIRAETVNTKLAAQGKDKLKGAALEQAKALIVLNEIQERSSDAQAAFANNQDSLARSSSRLNAALENIKDSLATGLTPVLASVASGLASIIAPSRSASQATEDLQVAFNLSINTLKRENITTETKKKLLDEVNATLKERHIPLLLTQKSTIDEITKAQNLANDSFTQEITLMAAKEKLIAVQKKQLDVKTEELELQKALTKEAQAYQDAQKVRPTARNDMGDQRSQSIGDGLMNAQKAVDGNIAKQKELQKEFANTMEAAQKLGIDVKKLLTPTTGGGGGDNFDPDAKKKEDEFVKNLERLREAEKSHRSDALSQNMRDDERDAERIREKYRKEIELATEMEAAKGKLGREAHDLRVSLEGLRDKEIEAKKLEQHEKIIVDLKKMSEKYAVNQGDLALDELGKKLKSIKDKFSDEFAKIAQSEKSDDPSVKAQAKQTRGDVEKAMNAEMEAERDRHVLAMLKKQDDLWQKTQLATAEGEEKEILETMFYYGGLIDAQIGHDDEIRKLAEAQKNALTAINKKYRLEDLKDQAEKNKQALQYERTVQEGHQKIQDARFGALKAGGDLLGAILGDNAKKSLAYFIFTKGLAIAEILINAQREAAMIRLAYAQIAALPYVVATVGGSVAAMATGTTLSTLAMVKGGLQAAAVGVMAIGEWKANQKMEGGYSNVVGAQDGKTYRAQYKGQAETGPVLHPSLFLAGEQPEYVIAYPEMQNPMVANFVGAIEGLRQRRVNGYMDGGQVETATRKTGVSTYQRPQISQNTEGSVQMPNAVFDLLMQTMEATRDAMQRGILIRYEDADHIDKMIKKVDENRGYAR